MYSVRDHHTDCFPSSASFLSLPPPPPLESLTAPSFFFTFKNDASILGKY